MPKIWEMTRDEFVGEWPLDCERTPTKDKLLGDEIDLLASAWLPNTMKQVAENIFIADVAPAEGDVALIYLERDGIYDIIGGYCSEILWIHERFRGLGLSKELVIEAANKKDGNLMPISYSPSGRAAHEAAHRTAVIRALTHGHAVPDEVLRDYPDVEECLLLGGFRLYEHNGLMDVPYVSVALDEDSKPGNILYRGLVWGRDPLGRSENSLTIRASSRFRDFKEAKEWTLRTTRSTDYWMANPNPFIGKIMKNEEEADLTTNAI